MFVNRTVDYGKIPFDIEKLKAHCRVEDASEENLLRNAGRTAAHEVEQFAQIALLKQAIRVTIFNGNSDTILNLPIGPSVAEDRPIVTINGEAFDDFQYIEGKRPAIVWGGTYSRLTPDSIIIQYNAGFGDSAAEIPPDLSQALMDQAALHYDGRSPMSAKDLTTSPHMARIGARYRGVSL